MHCIGQCLVIFIGSPYFEFNQNHSKPCYITIQMNEFVPMPRFLFSFHYFLSNFTHFRPHRTLNAPHLIGSIVSITNDYRFHFSFLSYFLVLLFVLMSLANMHFVSIFSSCRLVFLVLARHFVISSFWRLEQQPDLEPRDRSAHTHS